jgi:hypothetical protein
MERLKILDDLNKLGGNRVENKIKKIYLGL